MKENPCTNRQNSGYKTQCACREDIREEDISAGALQMVNFFTLSQRGRDVKIQDEVWRGRSQKKNPRFKKLGNARKRKKVEWMKGKLFLLFFSYRGTRRGRKHVYCVESCLHTYLNFYNVPYGRFKTIENDLLCEKKFTPIHKLNGAPSNNSTKQQTIDKMRNFFIALEEEGEPHATKVVRTRVGIALRDDDDILELPSSYSKRSLYCRLMYSWGWVVKASGRGLLERPAIAKFAILTGKIGWREKVRRYCR